MTSPLAMYLADIYTISVNLAGICGISVPAGFSAAGMPIGIQLLGPALGEKRLLQAAAAFEKVSGVAGQNPIEAITEQEWDFVFAVNCKGTFFFIKHVVPLMKARNYGKIVNYASKSGKTGSALCSHYSAAKGAIITLTQSLAFEFAKQGINVNCVCPGITDHTGVWSFMSANYIENLQQERAQVVKQFTSKVPLGRLADIEDVVDVTVFLCSSGADYMTGQAINITGGREMH